MRKLALLLVVAFGLTFASCEKCITCTYEVNGDTFSSGEVCGPSDQIDEVRTTWEAAATAAGATVTCVEE